MQEANIAWPDSDAGTELLRVHVEQPIDKLFALLYEPGSPFVLAWNSARAQKNYQESAWHTNLDELRHAASSPNLVAAGGIPSSGTPSQYAKRARRVTCEGAALGMKFVLEETQHCLEAIEGRSYTVECTVATTAKYGDKFRTLIRYWLSAQGPGACELRIAYTIVTIQPLSKILKPVVFKGVDSGLRRNFESLLTLLRQRCTVKDTAADVQAASQVPQEQATNGVPTPLPAGPGPAQRRQPWALSIGVTDKMVEGMRPWAVRLAAALPAVQGMLGTETLSTALCAAGLVIGMCVALSILNQLLAMSRGTPGWFATTCHWLLSFLQLPSSFTQLLSSLGLVWAVQYSFTALVTSYSSAGKRMGKASSKMLNIGRLASDMEYARGVRLEGFDTAMQRIGGMEQPQRGNQEDEGSGSRGQDSHQLAGGRKNKTSMKGFSKWFHETLNKPPGPSGVHASPSAPSLSTPRQGAEGSEQVQGNGASSTAVAASTPDIGSASGHLSVSGALSPRSVEGGEGVGSPPLSRPFSPETLLRRLRTPGQSRDWSDNVNATRQLPGLENGAAPGLVPHPSDNLSSLLKASWNTFISVEGGKVAAEGALERVPELLGHPAHLRSESITFEASPSQLELRLLGNSLDSDKVLEEVYENERFQPLRGWGHTWPGHFLPTDRVNHWSVPDGRTSAAFEEVVPQVEEGWDWVDPEWRVDMTGHADGLVDAEGWRYALDFIAMKPKPTAGSGRSKMKDFVRRRTWVRIRMRREEMQDSVMSSAENSRHGVLKSEAADTWMRTQRSFSDIGATALGLPVSAEPRDSAELDNLNRSVSTPSALDHDMVERLVVDCDRDADIDQAHEASSATADHPAAPASSQQAAAVPLLSPATTAGDLAAAGAAAGSGAVVAALPEAGTAPPPSSADGGLLGEPNAHVPDRAGSAQMQTLTRPGADATTNDSRECTSPMSHMRPNGHAVANGRQVPEDVPSTLSRGVHGSSTASCVPEEPAAPTSSDGDYQPLQPQSPAQAAAEDTPDVSSCMTPERGCKVLPANSLLSGHAPSQNVPSSASLAGAILAGSSLAHPLADGWEGHPVPVCEAAAVVDTQDTTAHMSQVGCAVTKTAPVGHSQENHDLASDAARTGAQPMKQGRGVEPVCDQVPAVACQEHGTQAAAVSPSPALHQRGETKVESSASMPPAAAVVVSPGSAAGHPDAAISLPGVVEVRHGPVAGEPGEANALAAATLGTLGPSLQEVGIATSPSAVKDTKGGMLNPEGAGADGGPAARPVVQVAAASGLPLRGIPASAAASKGYHGGAAGVEGASARHPARAGSLERDSGSAAVLEGTSGGLPAGAAGPQELSRSVPEQHGLSGAGAADVVKGFGSPMAEQPDDSSTTDEAIAPRGSSTSSTKTAQLALKMTALVESLKMVGSTSTAQAAAASLTAADGQLGSPGAEDVLPSSSSLTLSERLVRLTQDKSLLSSKLLSTFKSPRSSSTGESASHGSHRRAASFAAVTLPLQRALGSSSAARGNDADAAPSESSHDAEQAAVTVPAEAAGMAGGPSGKHRRVASYSSTSSGTPLSHAAKTVGASARTAAMLREALSGALSGTLSPTASPRRWSRMSAAGEEASFAMLSPSSSLPLAEQSATSDDNYSGGARGFETVGAPSLQLSGDAAGACLAGGASAPVHDTQLTSPKAGVSNFSAPLPKVLQAMENSVGQFKLAQSDAERPQ